MSVLSEEDYVAFLARLALQEGAGRSGSFNDATGYVLEAGALVVRAVSWLEEIFSSDKTETKDV